MKKFSQSLFIGRAIISIILIFLLVAFPLIKPSGDTVRAKKFGTNIALDVLRGTTRNIESKGIDFRSLPIRFEPNVGQTDPAVRFIARDREGIALLTTNETVMRVSRQTTEREQNSTIRHSRTKVHPNNTESAVLRLHTVGSNPQTRIKGLDLLPGTTNYFLGNDPKKWRTNVPSYARVKYENLYAGIDLIYYGNEGNLEYDFNVAPGADPDRIAISIAGAEGIEIDEAGNLLLKTTAGEVRQPAPHIFQNDNGIRREIAGGYAIRADGNISFNLSAYDVSKTLVIDPQLVYATYLGGIAPDQANGIAVDSAGSAYITGRTQSPDFPTRNPLQGTLTFQNAFITKLSPDGSALVYSTFLGGNGPDEAMGIAVDTTGAVYIAGNAGANFPTKNPLQGSNRGGQDAFLAKLSPDGASLVYSTYLGGSGDETAVGITLDSVNRAFVCGQTNSTDFPTMNPTQATYGGGDHDGFWAIVNANGSSLLFSTYLGGNGDDSTDSCAIDSKTGNIYVSGFSDSTNLSASTSSVASQDSRRDLTSQELCAYCRRYRYNSPTGGVQTDIFIRAGICDPSVDTYLYFTRP